MSTERKMLRVTTLSESSSSASLPSFKWKWKRRISLLRLYKIYKAELSSSNINAQDVWKKIADEVGKRSPYCPDAKQCRDQIHYLKCEYEKLKRNKPTDQFQAIVLDESENAFDESIENPVVFTLQSNLENVTMSKQDHIKLLQVYAKYKAELLLQNFDAEKQIIWTKVAREVSKKCSSYYGKRRCYYETNELNRLYEINKKKNLKIGSAPYFFDEAKKVFESTECTETTSNVPELSSSVSLPNFTWPWKKRLVLLRAYTIFKTELSSSNVNELSMWQKIAQVVGKKGLTCDAEQCRSHIQDMKSEYERMKNSKPYESNECEVVILDEAENAFENIENPVVFSVASNLDKWAMFKPDRVKLLQVYAKYKAELLLQNFDVEMQIVWGKVAREVSEICSSFYGKRRCCYLIHSFKKRYETITGKNYRIGKKEQDFFDEARKIFG